MENANLEMIVKKVQENMNMKEQTQWFSLDYYKRSAYFVDCVKHEISHVTFAMDIEITCAIEDKLVNMFFEKLY